MADDFDAAVMARVLLHDAALVYKLQSLHSTDL